MIKRTLTTAAAMLALAGTLAGSAAYAGTTPHATTRTLMSACVHGQTFGIDATTYVCQPVPPATTGHFPTRGYARTCHAYARWEAAGLPAPRQTRTLARDVTRLGNSLPDQVLRADVSALLVAMVARTNGAQPAMWVSRDCHTD